MREAETRAHVAGAALAREQGERRAQQVRHLRAARLCLCLQGYLAHKKTPTPLGPP